jgi:hypothetical protein
MRPPTHYDTLEISPQASPEVVRAAYRSLIQRFHPDRRPGDEQAAARAAAITAAYEVLSDTVRRAAYDEALAAARADEFPQAPRGTDTAAAEARGRAQAPPTRPVRSTSRAARWPWAWLAGLALVLLVVGGTIWLATSRPDPQAELTAIRQAFATGGQPEARLRELHARKQALVGQFPELRVRALAEEAQERRARTLDLFDSPLVVQVDKVQLTIPRLRVVLGSFDSVSLRARLVQQHHRLAGEVTRSLERADPAQLSGPLAEGYLKAIVLGALAQDAGARARESYPSTYFESPGRYGVVEVVLPEGFQLSPA